MKSKIFVLLFSCFIFIGGAYAKESYYVNEKGVSFTKEEYEFLSMMYWNGSQDLFNEEDYSKFVKSNIMNGDITIKEIKDEYNRALYSTSINDGSKTFKIASDCYISLTTNWTTVPSIRSYDVMGAYLENTSLVNNPVTTISSTSGTRTSGEIQKFNNGFGVSLSLPISGSSIVINQNFRVNKGGHVYASYQHATRVITLADSKNYTLSRNGYGGVFKFSGIASSVYDRMSGVDIAI
ncbi:MAG: hypothetical protein NC483_01700 [Ruminococcus sp.]|nr:hypothetical protein [Ruminococcus sp.]